MKETTLRKKSVCGVRFVAALAAFACVLMSFAEPVKVGNPGFPYSVPGAFLTVCRCEKGKYLFNTYPGLWIRNVSTSWRENFCRLVPSVDGKDVEVSACVMREGWLEARADKGSIEFTLKFCKLIMKSGFSENFDAKTGDARRDPAYTWTASAFLVLAHELQKK